MGHENQGLSGKWLTEMYIYLISTLAKYVRHFEISELSLSVQPASELVGLCLAHVMFLEDGLSYMMHHFCLFWTKVAMEKMTIWACFNNYRCIGYMLADRS